MSTTITATQHWIKRMVIGQNLCPFAKQPFAQGRIRYVLCEAEAEKELMACLQQEMTLLADYRQTQWSTTLIVHPHVLTNFYDYNDFLAVADRLLAKAGLEGVLQIASFHPDYQFAGAASDDVTNFTNRSPYPMLHLLKEAEVEAAIAHYPEPEFIPERNVRRMRELGLEGIKAILST